MNEALPTALLGDLVELQTEKVFSDKDVGLPYVGLEHIAQDAPRLLGTAQSKSSVSVNSAFKRNDILFGKLRPNLRKSVRAPFNGYCSTDILVLRCRDGVVPAFAGHIFQSERVFAAAAAMAAGTKMPRTSWSELRRLRVFNPNSESEQSRIAAVLDTIDEAIAGTEELIAKLTHVRAGLLQDLMTRGLDENGQLRDPAAHPEKFKPSKLGSIPIDWEVALLDDVAVRGSGHTPDKENPSYWNGGVKWVSLADSYRLDRIFISQTDKEISDLGIANSSAVKLPSGTVVISRDAGVGKSAILAETMAVSQHFITWTSGRKLSNLFLYYWLQHNKRSFESIAMGSTIKTIGLPFFKRLEIALPLRPEQDSASTTLYEMDQLIFSIERELEKQQMLRSGLSADLLSGRVRFPESIPGPEAHT